MTDYKTFSELQKGTWSNLTSYTIGDFVNYNGSQYTCVANNLNTLPTDTDYWVLVAEKGSQGVQGPAGSQGVQGDQGIPGLTFIGAWNNSTSYSVRDWVTYAGSSYYCIQAHSNQEPPNISYWVVLASKGIDGLGSGDVTGPSSATNGAIVLFDLTTGKLIKDSSKTITTSLGSDDTTVPTSKAVKDVTDNKIPTSYLDTDTALTANSDTKIPSQKAVKTYVDTNITVTADSTTTFTNKRINPRVVTAASYTTDTGTALDVSTCDEFDVTAQAGPLKLNDPGGTPVNGQKLIVRIKDDGTPRALTYDTQFRASSDLALPTTTVLSKTLYMGFIYNSADTKWDLLALLDNI